jgi:hypothetical protein
MIIDVYGYLTPEFSCKPQNKSACEARAIHSGLSAATIRYAIPRRFDRLGDAAEVRSM